MPQAGTELYVDLMKKILVNSIYRDPPILSVWWDSEYDDEVRRDGGDWPSVAHTMAGTKRLDHIQSCVESVLADDVPGDLIETGAWRGGAAIFMRALLRVHGVTDRRVWVADSFEGVPSMDSISDESEFVVEMLNDAKPVLAVPEQKVRENFEVYGLLDDQVRFLPGWFTDTLTAPPIDQLALLRVDAHLYDSTMDALVNLYPKLSPGGYAIVDNTFFDRGAELLEEFRSKFDISEPLRQIDDLTFYWRRGA